MSNAALRIEAPVMSDVDFAFFKRKIHDVAGLNFTDAKRELVRTRLQGRVRELGLSDLRAYRDRLETLQTGDAEWQEFINCLTTNKTDFFREPKHFEYLVREFLPAWLKRGEQTLKIWTAACSTGEEAYTLAIVLHKALPSDRNFKILATDIDTSVLKTAQNGVYRASRLIEVPAEHQSSFTRGTGDIKDWMRIKPQLRDTVTFKRHNLVDATFAGDNVFDVIFCRNVLIYFAPAEIDFVARKLAKSTKPGGFLFIGHSESLQGTKAEWTSAGPSIYRRGPAA